MLLAKYQPHWPRGSGGVVRMFLPYMDMAAILNFKS